jgi:diguanylate cyclase (GGDEF)-like protein
MRKHFGAGLISRLGGEEFAILMSGLDEDQLYTRLDDFRRSISVAQIAFEEQQINFSVSLGMIYNSQEPLAKQMSLADGALYYAKENGRNQISIVGASE